MQTKCVSFMIGVSIWSIEEPMAGSSAEVYDVCLYVYPFGGRLCCCWNRCDLFYGNRYGGGSGVWLFLAV